MEDTVLYDNDDDIIRRACKISHIKIGQIFKCIEDHWMISRNSHLAYLVWCCGSFVLVNVVIDVRVVHTAGYCVDLKVGHTMFCQASDLKDA